MNWELVGKRACIVGLALFLSCIACAVVIGGTPTSLSERPYRVYTKPNHPIPVDHATWIVGWIALYGLVASVPTMIIGSLVTAAFREVPDVPEVVVVSECARGGEAVEGESSSRGQS